LSTTEETIVPETEAQPPEDAHSHEGHAHEHTPGPALNPECRREVSIEVPAAEVDAQFAATLKKYRKQARIPGFRAGKVPESLLRRRFADQLQRDVSEALLPVVFRKEIEKQGLAPVSQPRVVDMHMHEGEPLRFKAEFEVLPDFSIAGYEHLRVEKPDTTLSEEEFARELESLRESRYTMEPLPEDHPLAMGDFAQITFQGFFADGADPQAGEERTPELNGRNAMVEIGGPDTVEAFTAALQGVTVGQQLTLEVEYPADFNEKKLAGKKVRYEIEVTAARKKVVPELNDDLAKEIGDYANIEEFKEKFREHTAARKQRQMEGEAREKLIRALTEKFTFPVPETMVQQQIDTRLERGLRALAAQGMKTDDMRKLDFERLREGQREGAVHEVKAALVMDKIADAENVTVADSEVDDEIVKASVETRESYDSIRKRLTEDGTLGKIREQIRREKAASLLYSRMM
jgi:trigger factor